MKAEVIKQTDIWKHRKALGDRLHAKVAEIIAETDPKEIERFLAKWSITLPEESKREAA